MRANEIAGRLPRQGIVRLQVLAAMAVSFAAIFAAGLHEAPEGTGTPATSCAACNPVPAPYQPAFNGFLGSEASVSAYGDLYAAIAYSKEAHRWGDGYNFLTRQAAEARALERCGDSRCRIIGWARNGCCALAVGDAGNYGFSYRYGAYDYSLARSNALTLCSSRDTNCRIVSWACTDR